MSSQERSLDRKLKNILAGDYRPVDFIIADAKDGDMANGVTTPGLNLATERFRPLAAYRHQMKEVVASGLADIMLMSVSSAEALTGQDVFASNPITPAVRLNDATDIWKARGSTYQSKMALPFRTARLDHARKVSDLGLYAITFYNDRTRDVETLAAYREFREAAELVGMRHFLEVFNPALTVLTPGAPYWSFMNDSIARCLAGVARNERPIFLKMPYNGARAMEELAAFDPEGLVVGILGGGAGTTRDTFELVLRAERHGARIALFGRKIYNAEAPLEIIQSMRNVVEGKASPEEEVRRYHDSLASAGLTPKRTLNEDLQVTEPVLISEG